MTGSSSSNSLGIGGRARDGEVGAEAKEEDALLEGGLLLCGTRSGSCEEEAALAVMACETGGATGAVALLIESWMNRRMRKIHRFISFSLAAWMR